MASRRFEGYALLCALLGSVFAALAILLYMGFLTPSVTYLTETEWEALAILLYIFAVGLYVGGGSGTSRRAVGVVGFLPVRATRRSLRGSVRAEDHDASYAETVVASEA